MSRGVLAKQPETPHRVGECLAEFAVGDRTSALASPEALALAIRREVLPALETALAMAQAHGIGGRFEMIEIDLGDLADPPDWPALRERFAQRLFLALRAQAQSAPSARPADGAPDTPGTAHLAWTAQPQAHPEQDQSARHRAGDVLGILRALAALPQGDRLAELRRLRTALQLPPTEVPFDVDGDWRSVTRDQEAQLVAALIAAGLAPHRQAEATRIIRSVLDGARGRFGADADPVARSVFGQGAANVPGQGASPRTPEGAALIAPPLRETLLKGAEGAAPPGAVGDRNGAEAGKTVIAGGAEADRVTGNTGKVGGLSDPGDAGALATSADTQAKATQPPETDRPDQDALVPLPVPLSQTRRDGQDAEPAGGDGVAPAPTSVVLDGHALPRSTDRSPGEPLVSPRHASGFPGAGPQERTRAPASGSGSRSDGGGPGATVADASQASGPAPLAADHAASTAPDRHADLAGQTPEGDGASFNEVPPNADPAPSGDTRLGRADPASGAGGRSYGDGKKADDADTTQAGDPAPLGADGGEGGAGRPDPDRQARSERDSAAGVLGGDTGAKGSGERASPDQTLPAFPEDPAETDADMQRDRAADAAQAPVASGGLAGSAGGTGGSRQAAVGGSFEGADTAQDLAQDTAQERAQDRDQDTVPALRAQILALLEALGPVPADIAQAIARLPHGPLAQLHAHLLRAVINLTVPKDPELAEALAQFALYEDLSRLAETQAHDPKTLGPALARLPLVVVRLLALRLAPLDGQADDRAPGKRPQAAQDDNPPSAQALAASLSYALARALPTLRDAQDRPAVQARSRAVPKGSDGPAAQGDPTGQSAAPEGWLRDAVTAGDAAAVDDVFRRDPFGLLSMLERHSAQDLAALAVVLGGAAQKDAVRQQGREMDQRQGGAAPQVPPEALLAEVIARLSERQDVASGSPRPVRQLGHAGESALGADQPGRPPSDAALPPGGAMLADALRLVWSVLPGGVTATPGSAASPGTGLQGDDRAIAGMGDGTAAQAKGHGPDPALPEAIEGSYVALIVDAGRVQRDSAGEGQAKLAQAIATVLQGVTQVDDRAEVIAALHARWRLAASMGAGAAPLAQDLLAALYSIIPDLQLVEPGQAGSALAQRDRSQAFVEGAYILAVTGASSDPAQADDMVDDMFLRAKGLGLADGEAAVAMDRLAGRLVQAGDPVPALSRALATLRAVTASRANAVSRDGGGAALVYAQALQTLSAPRAETRTLPMVVQLQTAVGDILATLATPEQRRLALRTAYARLRYATTPAQGPRQLALSALRGLDPTLRDPSGDDAHGHLTRVAGVVLIGPYLKPLFARSALLDAENRIAPGQLGRAASLLRAVSGLVGEGLDPLERVLLGVPYGIDIPFLPLSQAQAELVESLLGALIQQWSALGKTSVGGLREAFLCREGDLFRDSAGGARLIVHKGAFDVLLDRLPWSLSPLRAPWMPAPLIVRWRSQDD